MMTRKLPSRRLLLACGLTALLVPFVGADDKKADAKPAVSGKWAKKEGQVCVEFVDKEVLKIHPHGDKAEFTVVCSYTVAKGGVVKAKITELEGSAELKEKAKNRLPVDSEFSFKWVADGKTGTVEEFESKTLDGLKSLFEGEYEKK
jgi:hypothetical protein